MLFEKGSTKTMSGPSAQLQGIILAGQSSNSNTMFPLINEENFPKALLPVAGKPMIYYQLQWLEKANIRDIMILCRGSARQKIRDYVQKVYEVGEGSGAARIHVHSVPSSAGDGTADALRAFKDMIKTDFILVTCDLITDMPPRHFVDLHHNQSPTVTALFYDYAKLASGPERPSKNEKENEKMEYIGLDMTQSRVVMIKPKDEVDDAGLPVRTSVLRKFPRTRIHVNLRSAHAYILKHWVLDLIVKNKSISSVRTDLLPALVECQSRRSAAKREGVDEFLASNPDFFKDALALSTTSFSQIGESGTESDNDEVLCLAVVCKDALCARANTIWSYPEINRQMAKNANENRIAKSADVASRTQIGPDSMIGEGSKMGEKCSVKKSVIGSHCSIGKNVQITRSVIMDYAVIEDNVKLEGCIVCHNAKIQEKASLRDCQVGAGIVVSKGDEARGKDWA
ncbi:hypothetical protein HK104_007836 [Borealophlyctis nickersoniae]|nr:hypothetical protein HK104_007836 [Borealophlyctis nickersoniae]